MEFGLSELYLRRNKGVPKTYVVSCAIYLRNLHVLHFFCILLPWVVVIYPIDLLQYFS